MKSSLSVHAFQPSSRQLWADLLADSENGTVFHSLDFLDYHAPDKFAVSHLVIQDGDRVVGVLPAALAKKNGTRVLLSPYGASVGGPVFASGTTYTEYVQAVGALAQYCGQAGITEMRFNIAPNIWHRIRSDKLRVALHSGGFHLRKSWLAPVIDLESGREAIESKLNRRRKQYLRACSRNKLRIRLGGIDDVPAFFHMLKENRAKFGVLPTHERGEIERLFSLIPDEISLFLCKREDTLLSGMLLFEATPSVVYAMYLCHDANYEKYRASMFIVVEVAKLLSDSGFRHLDLGPSTKDDMTINYGGMKLKEELGGVGFARESWVWSSADQESR